MNHRMGLYDAAMIKENHIAWTDNLKNAVQKIRLNSPFTTHIIIEAENIELSFNYDMSCKRRI